MSDKARECCVRKDGVLVKDVHADNCPWILAAKIWNELDAKTIGNAKPIVLDMLAAYADSVTAALQARIKELDKLLQEEREEVMLKAACIKGLRAALVRVERETVEKCANIAYRSATNSKWGSDEEHFLMRLSDDIRALAPKDVQPEGKQDVP